MPDQEDTTPKILTETTQELAQEASARASRLVAEQTARVAAREMAEGANRAAHGALDALEKMLFGKTGGAEEAIQKFSTGDSLESLRAQYGLNQTSKAEPDKSPTPPPEDPVAKAKAQLEALKKARAQGAPPPPSVKKTL